MGKLPEESIVIIGSMFIGSFAFIGIILAIFASPVRDDMQCKDELKYNPSTGKSVYYKCEIKK